MGAAIMPALVAIPLVLWNLIQGINTRLAGPLVQRKRKGWEARVNMAISQIVSDQTSTGQLLVNRFPSLETCLSHSGGFLETVWIHR